LMMMSASPDGSVGCGRPLDTDVKDIHIEGIHVDVN
jgi:hypothetical protein